MTNIFPVPPIGGGQVQAESDSGQVNTFAIAQSLVATVARELSDELHQLVEDIGHLKEQMAGFRPDPTGDDARRRLQNPRLRTTYVDERIRALTAATICMREDLSKKMQDVIKPALKLELAEAELAAALALRAELDLVRVAREATGLYPAVASAADYLFDQHRVTHWHWSNASPECLRAIAAILRRQPPAENGSD